MISLMFLLTGELLIRILIFLLSVLNYVLPPTVSSGITYFAGYLTYAGFFFPINTLLQATGSYLLFLTYWYGFKLTEWFIGFIPFLNTRQYNPVLRRESNFLDLDKYN